VDVRPTRANFATIDIGTFGEHLVDGVTSASLISSGALG
jgi:hypothetical protein